MAALVRASKFRNTVVSPHKREYCYDNLKPADGGPVSGAYGQKIAASKTCIAYVDKSSSGSCIGVLPLSSVGRRHAYQTYQQPLIRANSSPVHCLAFSPHENILASGNQNGTLSLFNIPEDGLIEDLKSPAAFMVAPGERPAPITSLALHKAAKNICATSGGKNLHLWDLEKGKLVIAIEDQHPDHVTAVCWNWAGDLLLTASRDKLIRLFDARASRAAVGTAPGLSRSAVSWGSRGNMFFSCGHSPRMDRQLQLFDMKMLAKPFEIVRVDSSSNPMIPLYDDDTDLLFLCSRGDAVVKLFERSNAEKKPTVHPLSSNTLGGANTNDVTLLPKLAVDAKKCEIARLLRLTRESIDPVRIEVPRKEKTFAFQSDLFPDTASPTPSMSAAEYLAGKLIPPELVSVEKFSASLERSTMTVAPANRESTLKVAAESPTMSKRQSRAQSLFSGQSKFKYLSMKTCSRGSTYFNLNVDTSAVDSMVIAGSARRFAVPWKTLAGGSIYVGELEKPGKLISKNVPLLTGHTEKISTLAFNPFDENVLASSGEEGNIVLWKLPSVGVQQGFGLGDERTTLLNGHTKGVRNIAWHPCAANTLASASIDMTIRLWDVQAQKSVSSHVESSGKITSLGWDYNGVSLYVSTRTCILQVDPRVSENAATTILENPHSGGKGIKSTVMRDPNFVASIGFSSMARREFKIWDIRKTEKPTHCETIDHGAGILWPFYDADTGCLFLSSKGESTLHVYEVCSDGSVLKCSPCSVGGDPLAGLTFLPKTSCNIKSVEFCKALRCTQGAVEPLSFSLPRSADLVSWFQDDIFPLTRSTTGASMSASSFFSGELAPPKLVDLCPSGMKPVSAKPLDESPKQTVTAKYIAQRKSAVEQQAEKDKAFNRLQSLAVQHAQYHTNESMGKRGQTKGIKVKGEHVAEIDSGSSDSGWSDDD